MLNTNLNNVARLQSQLQYGHSVTLLIFGIKNITACQWKNNLISNSKSELEVLMYVVIDKNKFNYRSIIFPRHFLP